MIQALKFFFEGCGVKRSSRSTGRMKFQLQVISYDQRRDQSMTIKQDRVPYKILNRNITHAQWFLLSNHLLLILSRRHEFWSGWGSQLSTDIMLDLEHNKPEKRIKRYRICRVSKHGLGYM